MTKKIVFEKVLMNVPYCKIILRNMLNDENGAEFSYNNVPVKIKAGEEIEIKKEIADYLDSISIRKSRYVHTGAHNTLGTKEYYEQKRFIIQYLDTYEKEEMVRRPKQDEPELEVKKTKTKA